MRITRRHPAALECSTSPDADSAARARVWTNCALPGPLAERGKGPGGRVACDLLIRKGTALNGGARPLARQRRKYFRAGACSPPGDARQAAKTGTRRRGPVCGAAESGWAARSWAWGTRENHERNGTVYGCTRTVGSRDRRVWLGRKEKRVVERVCDIRFATTGEARRRLGSHEATGRSALHVTSRAGTPPARTA
ncbi:hypothetical protein EJ06DRAFT_402768 [Trichodelitschia bisporula]|uniref:Uncharacterized protein n=1 Tax=Trichodelitschia bisporula TaxID=703511 RepID=A0A6G1HY82_9PEZI|nr:hypothetical protein EJ06DRAFT_402768 [Trichodelitschia bisporula]